MTIMSIKEINLLMLSNIKTSNKIKELFWKYVDKKNIDECWNWIGPHVKGYGRISYKGRKISAPKFSYYLVYGIFKVGLCVLHKCDNRFCVNPYHLYIGTRADNGRDLSERYESCINSDKSYQLSGIWKNKTKRYFF